MSNLLEEIFREAGLGCTHAGCQCLACSSEKSNRSETSVMQEILLEAFSEKEVVVLELSLPGQPYAPVPDRELDAIGKRLAACLAKAAIPGIRQTTVQKSEYAEIVMEVQYETWPQTTINRTRGNRLRDSIGEALEGCNRLFRLVKVEGQPGVNNRFDTRAGPRYVDVRVVDKKTGRTINIEVKRGNSRYNSRQKGKDQNLAGSGKGRTYVVRGTPARKGREI